MSGISERRYARPLPCSPDAPGAVRLAGGLFAFAEVEVLRRNGPAETLPTDAARALYPDLEGMLTRLAATRLPLAGLSMDRPTHP